MPATLTDTRETQPPPPTFCPAVDVRGFSNQDRYQILAALEGTLNSCGCWLLDQRALSAAKMEMVFEVQLRSALDLYGALIAAGVELSRDSHATLTRLWTLRRHNMQSGVHGNLVSVRLEISFVEENAAEFDLGMVGLA